jgi:hypothetical protein
MMTREERLGYCIEELKEIHDTYHPSAIIVTQTSGTPSGWVLKEAYKTAYPNEPTPKILTIDVKGVRDADSQRRMEKFDKVVQEMKRKLKKVNSKGNIVVVDEASSLGENGDLAKRTGKNTYEITDSNYDPSKKVRARTLHIASHVLQKAVSELGYNTRVGACHFSPSYIFAPTPLEKIRNPELTPQYKAWQSYEGDSGEEEIGITGKENYNALRRGMAVLKREGREIGERIRAEREAKQKGLEGTLGIISIAGFLFSILFLSGITGNVIGATETKSLIGIISVLIGLTFGGIYLYLKKKTN